MNSISISLIVFACAIGGALIGLLLGAVLPPPHLSGDSKELVRLGMGLIATMTAILLGLLIASAKTFYDTQNSELTEMSAKVILLDRVLAHYGPEAKEARDVLQAAVTRLFDAMSQGGRQKSQMTSTPSGAEILYEKIQELSPQNVTQHSLQTEALSLVIDLGKTRWLMFEQGSTSVSLPLLVVVIFWLALIFCSFGLLAPRNATVVATLSLCALSVSAAIFLVLEMYSPFSGVVRISSAPLRNALAHLEK
ncbi:MAG TPA: hypothetical protein VFO40_03870 [Chthoniobacterales bacterium]|nr:hypothetical protein [Chthoniobacterales bacterium]